MPDTLIIFHSYGSKHCADGLAAAWVAKKKYPYADLVGAVYSQPLNANVHDYKEIVIVDFSFPKDTILEWANEGINVTLIDHHKTALNDLSDLINQVLSPNTNIFFDMAESGATLTWKTLFPDQPMPAFLAYIKDRDIWEFKLPSTKEVSAAMHSMGHNFAMYDVLESMDQQELVNHLYDLGAKKLAEHEEKVRAIADTFQFEQVAGYERIPLVRLSSSEAGFVSDVCHTLCKRYPNAPFAACLIDGKKYSLRSDKDGNNTDVSAIAKAFGGGGHHCASGFELN